jgi:hypothetical protein
LKRRKGDEEGDFKGKEEVKRRRRPRMQCYVAKGEYKKGGYFINESQKLVTPGPRSTALPYRLLIGYFPVQAESNQGEYSR